MSRKQPKRRAGNMVFSAIAGIFIVAIVGGVGLGVTSANANDGIGGAAAPASGEAAKAMPGTQSETTSEEESLEYYERSALAFTSARSIDSGMKMLDDREREAAEQAARQDAEALERVVANKAMQGVSSAPIEPSSADAERSPEDATLDGESEYGLPAVDWSVGRESFVAMWGSRINDYLIGSELEGYGPVFAEAAWENGIDPRWSPAISNTESGKGAVCFLPHNAWGWGASSWDDWDSAIRGHVAGLASGYGYCLTLEAAGAYCPPNQQGWYETTLNEMSMI